MKKILVSGGAGFIGSHLVDRLAELGHEVVVVDDFSLGREENLAAHRKTGTVAVYRKSICDDLTEIFQRHSGCAAVFHVAALPRVQFSIQNPVETNQANVVGTLNLLEACRKFKIPRFVFSSSSSIYGDQKTLPLVETMPPNPMSPYALHKLIGEHYGRLYRTLYGVETVSLRYFNVYGPRQNPGGDYATLIPRFIVQIERNQAPTINGDGEQTRDFTYVADVVEANLLAMTTANPDCFGQAFNVGAGNNLSVNEVTRKIAALSGKKIEPVHGPAVIEPKHTRADISKIRSLLGWQPGTEFEPGLKKTFDAFREKPQDRLS